MLINIDDSCIRNKHSFAIEMEAVHEEDENFVDNPSNFDTNTMLQHKSSLSSSERPKRARCSDESMRSIESFASYYESTMANRNSTISLKEELHNGNKRQKKWRPSVFLTRNSQLSYRSKERAENSSREEVQQIVATDVAACIINESKTLGLMAALLSSWAAAVYAGDAPLDEGLCYGRTMLKVSYATFGVSLGFFFICVASTLAIIADLDGVPQKYLFQHLQQTHVRIIYQLPQLSMTLGVMLLAVGYSVDVGERAGCDFLYFGCLAAFSFVALVGMLFWLLKRARKKLRRNCVDEDEDISKDLILGRYCIATWRDRLDYMVSDKEQSVDGSHRTPVYD